MTDVLTSSGLLAASTVVQAYGCGLMSVIALADGTNQATITVWDSANTTTTGKLILARVIVDAGLVYEEFSTNRLIRANFGLYVELSGTGATALIQYSPMA